MSEPKYRVGTLIWLSLWAFAASICSADDDAQYQRPRNPTWRSS